MPNLTTGKIGPQIRQLAIPMSIGMFFDTMYNVVDGYFAGIYSTDALAAISISFPIFFLIIALGFGMGSGVSVLISNAIGENNDLKMKTYILESLSFGLILGLLLSLLGVIFSPFLLRLLGAEGNFLDLSIQYMRVISFSSIFLIITFFANSILQSKGDTKSYGKILAAGFFLNIILDPLFIYGIGPFKGFGFSGIAIATLITIAIGSFYLMYKVYLLGYFDNFKIKNLKPDITTYKEIIKQGLPASGNMLSVAIGMFVIIYFVALYSKEAIAAYGVATRIEQIALMPTIGLNIAVLVLVGQNNGAKRYNRIEKILKRSFLYGVIILIVMEIPIYIFARELVGIFTTSKEVIDIGTLAVRIGSFTSLSYLILFMYTSALQGMKKPNFALWIGLYRQIIAPGIIFYLITSVFFFKIGIIWWSIFGINGLAAIIAYFYTFHVIKKLKNRNRKLKN
ncbi:MAG: MATE family efflux transporter [Candidatus Gracilibacteria bacterium]